MSQWRRFAYGAAGTIGLGVLGIIYYRIAVPFFEMSTTGEHQGPFSHVAQWGLDITPYIIAILLLALWLWVAVGAVQKERTLERRVIRR